MESVEKLAFISERQILPNNQKIYKFNFQSVYYSVSMEDIVFLLLKPE